MSAISFFFSLFHYQNPKMRLFQRCVHSMPLRATSDSYSFDAHSLCLMIPLKPLSSPPPLTSSLVFLLLSSEKPLIKSCDALLLRSQLFTATNCVNLFLFSRLPLWSVVHLKLCFLSVTTPRYISIYSSD